MKKTITAMLLSIAAITAVSAESSNTDNNGNGLGAFIKTEMKVEGMMKMMGTGSSTVDAQIKALNIEMETKIKAIITEYKAKIKAIMDANKDLKFNVVAPIIKDMKKNMKEIKGDMHDARKENRDSREYGDELENVASGTRELGKGMVDFMRSFMNRFVK